MLNFKNWSDKPLYNIIVIRQADSTKDDHKVNYSHIFCWGLPGFFYCTAHKLKRLEWDQERGQLNEHSQKNKLEYKTFLLAIYKDRSFE